jgi:hypothetical protein
MASAALGHPAHRATHVGWGERSEPQQSHAQHPPEIDAFRLVRKGDRKSPAHSSTDVVNEKGKHKWK